MAVAPHSVVAAVLVAMVVAGAVPASAAGFTDADYLVFADEIAQRLDYSWVAEDGRYSVGSRGLDSIYNALLLTIHATAAAHDHHGPARNDERARRIAQRLCESPPFYAEAAAPREDTMFHTPGWTGNMVGDYVAMDKAIDPKIAEALALTWQARGRLALPDETAVAIGDRIGRVARTAFFRYPTVRLNQINWNAELYAHHALVNGDTGLLVDDYRRHVTRFVEGIRRPWLAPARDAAPTLSPSLRFHYKPDQVSTSGTNLDSAEYANMTLHFISVYERARRAGMPPLAREDLRLLRAWVRRTLFGYWTHAGFLNWDTGLGLRRWMKGKTWAYAQQGLLAIAASPAFDDDPRQRAWAKALFDRGLGLYRRLDLAGPHLIGLPHPALFGVEPARQWPADARIFAARMGANAARAVTLGLGRSPGVEPPPFYAFDPDVGRLAVSTPAYSTAVVAVNRGAFPYGGMELARVFDADSDPLTGVGGTAPAAPGILVRDRHGRVVLASQVGLSRDPRRPPIRLTQSPEGPVMRADRRPGRPHAGTFDALEAIGHRERHDLRITTRHRFTPRTIEETWRVTRRHGRRWYTASVVLPSWGAAASIDAVLKDGTVAELASGGVLVGTAHLAQVQRLRVHGATGEYAVIPLGAHSGIARAVAVAPQSSAPNPGPALEIILGTGRAFKQLQLRAHVVPTAG